MAKEIIIHAKMETILITNCKKSVTINIRVGNLKIISKPIIRKGIIIDAKLNYTRHTSHTRKKTITANSFMARMKPNVVETNV